MTGKAGPHLPPAQKTAAPAAAAGKREDLRM